MLEDFAIYVLRYWNQVAENQAFALQHLQAFRRGIGKIQLPTFSNIAKLLLLAERATKARFSVDLRKTLIEASEKPGL